MSSLSLRWLVEKVMFMKLCFFLFVVTWVVVFLLDALARSIVNYQIKIRSMKSNISWKTTLTGLLTALVPLISALIDAYNSGQFTGKDGIGLALAVGIFLQGYFAKDKDVSGLPGQNPVVSLQPVVQCHDPNAFAGELLKVLKGANAVPSSAPAANNPGAVADPGVNPEETVIRREPGI